METLGGGPDIELLLAAPVETRKAMEMEAFSLEDLIEPANPGIINPMGGIIAKVKTQDLQFFPTAEGFYDYQKNQYIYQYKDHLGNNRVSFARNSAGVFEITDANDYYPFGMNHLKTGNAFFGQGSYKSYKYNGKELQETGMYDYGARFYMPDIGRWGVKDPLMEMYYEYSPYNYAANNPIKYIDPNGMWIDVMDGDQKYRYNNGKLYSQNAETKKWDVEASVKSDSYSGKILSALNSMTGNDKDSFGSKFLNLFSNDDINTTIQSNNLSGDNARRNGTTYDGSKIFTSFSQSDKIETSMLGERAKSQNVVFHVSLFHEIGHSFLDQTKSNNSLRAVWLNGEDNNLSKNVNASEIAASYIENLLRNEQGLPLRMSYQPEVSSSKLIDTIKLQPTIIKNSSGTIKSNVMNRVFTMPNSVQTLYNSIMNSKK